MYQVGKYRSKRSSCQLSSTVDSMKKHFTSLRSACRHTNMHWSQFHGCTKMHTSKTQKQKFKRKLYESDKKNIGEFFQSDHSTFPLPDKKYSGKRFMRKSLAKTCKMYNLLPTTTQKVCPSTFRKYKPKYVKLQGKIPWRQSCCEVCQNFEFVIGQASRYLDGVPKTIDDCIDSSMCGYTTYFPKINCALRNCNQCTIDSFKTRLENLNQGKFQDTRKRFLVRKWENKKERIPGSDKYKTIMSWSHDRLSYRGLLEKYVNFVEQMSSHSFFASWNFHQYLVCKANLEKGQIVCVHDFAQNYLCVQQNEPQALHWSHVQVTLHPSCISYRCPIEDCNQLVLHEIIHVSDDLKHDAHLVKKMQIANLNILQKRGVDIRKIVEFTDQAPSQYKNKSAFRYLSQQSIPTQRNFFGVRHGKGPCDACAGRVKSKLASLVKSQNCIITDAKSCFEALQKNMETPWPNKNECCHYILTVNYTRKIPNRPNTKKWQGVKDTREYIHSICNTGKNFTVNVRNVVCLCEGCLHGKSDCRYKDFVDNWTGFDMKNFQPIPADLKLWSSVNIRKKVGNRDSYSWQDAQDKLSSFTSYAELKDYISKNPIPFFDCHINSILSDEDRDNLDLVALHYCPPDAPEGFAPCKIGADGNCFPRTLSFICFRTQEMYMEMRVRLVYEAVLNAKYYISNKYLSRGCNIVYRRGGPCKQIAMYSACYNPCEQLDIVNIYKAEVLEICKEGSYCGLWQMSQASNVLRRPVVSVYPQELHEGMRLDFNRVFQCIDTKYNNREPVVIMWTPMQVSRNSFPIHFVPLLKAVSYNNVQIRKFTYLCSIFFNFLQLFCYLYL